MHRNVYTWCQERYDDYPAPPEGETVEDKEDDISISTTQGRVLRGGAFGYHPGDVRSANRNRDVPSDRDADVGFRPARTFR